MNGDGNFFWWWAYGTSDPEIFNGPFGTREEAIEAAKSSDGEITGFTITEADRCIPRVDIFSADEVFERFEERNCECWDEDGGPGVDCTRDQEKDLEAMLAAAFEEWFKKHQIQRAGWAFGVMRNTEVFNPGE